MLHSSECFIIFVSTSCWVFGLLPLRSCFGWYMVSHACLPYHILCVPENAINRTNGQPHVCQSSLRPVTSCLGCVCVCVFFYFLPIPISSREVCLYPLPSTPASLRRYCYCFACFGFQLMGSNSPLASASWVASWIVDTHSNASFLFLKNFKLCFCLFEMCIYAFVGSGEECKPLIYVEIIGQLDQRPIYLLPSGPWEPNSGRHQIGNRLPLLSHFASPNRSLKFLIIDILKS